MNVLYDLTATQPRGIIQYHGGSEYAKVVFKAINNKESTCKVYALYDKNLPLDSDIKHHASEKSIILIPINDFQNFVEIISQYHIDRLYSALLYELLDRYSIIGFENLEIILTIHGLRALELPYDRYEEKYLKGIRSHVRFLYKKYTGKHYRQKLINRLNNLKEQVKKLTIITVSNHSKYSILTYFNSIKSQDIQVLYSPLSDYRIKENCDIDLQAYQVVTKKYFLVLSSGIWTKNSYRLVKAFDQLVSQHKSMEYKLLLLGFNLKKEFSVLNRDYIIFKNYQDRDILECLIKNAFALVYPTLNEGFGYPPLEAMKYGVPVIASGLGPIYETCNNKALYFNPYSIQDMQIKIMQSLNEFYVLDKFKSDPLIKQYQKIKSKQEIHLEQLVKIITS